MDRICHRVDASKRNPWLWTLERRELAARRGKGERLTGWEDGVVLLSQERKGGRVGMG